MNHRTLLFFLLVTMMITGGCASIPVALQIASMVAGSASYIITGKSLADNVISFATKKDCALHRIALNQFFCIPRRSERILPDAAPSAALAMTDLSWATPSLSLPPKNDAAPLLSSAQPLDITTPPVTVVPTTRAEAHPAHAAIDDYLVIGAYRDKANADEQVQTYAMFRPQIVEPWHDGKTLYRVVVAVAPRDSMVLMQSRLKRSGLPGAWAAKLCSGTLAPPPCGDDHNEIAIASVIVE